ncbi:vitellogenin ii [Elizabethkingia argentiflava]|uniref:Vitellogenin ii n=2 Tax=Elizabethkingia argenteiflava TaxID=2681556 RepID=A0A845PUF6_9FLAO|nr:vitellogenin ii [Elizabethkingia argenteiflava]
MNNKTIIGMLSLFRCNLLTSLALMGTLTSCASYLNGYTETDGAYYDPQRDSVPDYGTYASSERQIGDYYSYDDVPNGQSVIRQGQDNQKAQKERYKNWNGVNTDSDWGEYTGTQTYVSHNYYGGMWGSYYGWGGYYPYFYNPYWGFGWGYPAVSWRIGFGWAGYYPGWGYDPFGGWGYPYYGAYYRAGYYRPPYRTRYVGGNLGATAFRNQQGVRYPNQGNYRVQRQSVPQRSWNDSDSGIRRDNGFNRSMERQAVPQRSWNNSRPSDGGFRGNSGFSSGGQRSMGSGNGFRTGGRR